MTGPVATSAGNVSYADCMEEKACMACGSVMAATADLETHEGSAEDMPGGAVLATAAAAE